jgi:hypothetical protein
MNEFNVKEPSAHEEKNTNECFVENLFNESVFILRIIKVMKKESLD